MSSLRVKFFGGILAIFSATIAARAGTITPATRPVNSSAGSVVRPWMPKGFHAVRDLVYVPHGGRSQTLDVYVPDVPTGPRPLMVWIHGGGWYSGDKSAPPGMGLLQRGYVVASINYRLSGEAVFPAQIFDCKAAIRFLRVNAKQFGIDPTKIGVWGDSAGGHLAALLGATNGRLDYEGTEGNSGVSSEVEAVCDWFGPSDFLQTTEFTGASATAVSKLFGGTLAARADTAKFASPARQIGRGKLPPFLIMHGDQDRLVPEHQSEILYQKLKFAGAAVQLVVVRNAGHGNGWFKSRDDVTMVYDFFDRCFRKTRMRAEVPTTRPAT